MVHGPKFGLEVREPLWGVLEAEAKRRHVDVQELLRAVVVPEWLRLEGSGAFRCRECGSRLVRSL